MGAGSTDSDDVRDDDLDRGFGAIKGLFVMIQERVLVKGRSDSSELLGEYLLKLYSIWDVRSNYRYQCSIYIKAGAPRVPGCILD